MRALLCVSKSARENCVLHGKSVSIELLLFKVTYYSLPKKKIKVLGSVEFKQQEVSSEVLVTAIDVKCNFTEQINANQGKC